LRSEGVEDDFAEMIRTLPPEKIAGRISRGVRSNDSWRRRCLNLNAAESVMSPLAQRAYESDFERRVFFDHPYYRGARFYRDINRITMELALRIFEADYVEHRGLSGSVVNATLLRCTTQVGDTICGIQTPIGHPTWSQNGYPAYRGLTVKSIPFDFDEWEIDLDQLARDARKYKPRIIVVGHSTILFPHPTPAIREIAEEVGAKVWFDGAHVMGLIAGKRFPNPLQAGGADFLTGSTQKTLSGPLGGLVLLSDPEVSREMGSNYHQLFASTGHNRIAALAMTLAEWLRFGEAFASQMIKNARELGKRLDMSGVEIKQRAKSYTGTHMVLADLTSLGEAGELAEMLERANVVTSAVRLTADTERFNGLRLGVTEMTRYGMREREMKKIAEFIARVVVEKERPESLAPEVGAFRKKFAAIQ
jgi:glycine hydroxymethyltransferase